MDFLQLISWNVVVAGGGAVVAVGLFVQNMLTIRKLKFENQLLLGKLSGGEKRIKAPTAEDVAKYGNRGTLKDRIESHRLSIGVIVLFSAALFGYSLGRMYEPASKASQLTGKLERAQDENRRLRQELARVQEFPADARIRVAQVEAENRHLRQLLESRMGSLPASEAVKITGVVFRLHLCRLEGVGVDCQVQVTSERSAYTLLISPATRIVDRRGNSYPLAKSSPELAHGYSLVTGLPLLLRLYFEHPGSEIERIALLEIRLAGSTVQFRDIPVSKE